MSQTQAPLISRRRFDGEEDGNPSRLLALAVFLQAFQDLREGCPEARAWLFAPENGDLQYWADVADLSVTRLRRRAEEVIMAHRWRRVRAVEAPLRMTKEGLAVVCPECGAHVLIVEESGVDECAACGVQVRIAIEWIPEVVYDGMRPPRGKVAKA